MVLPAPIFRMTIPAIVFRATLVATAKTTTICECPTHAIGVLHAGAIMKIGLRLFLTCGLSPFFLTCGLSSLSGAHIFRICA